MQILSILDITIPLTNPVQNFFVILIIILFCPLIFNKIKIPHILGLIIAGAIVGPNGINLIMRDNGIILSGTVGLLCIMFMAGLEIDLADFKRNSLKSLLFGFFTFIIPMTLGTFVSYCIMKFSIATSILLASMFASHTLIAYPILTKYGVNKRKAVNITIGGTMITDILALLVLAIIVKMSVGEANSNFWIQLSISMIVFALIIVFGFPIIARWFFKRTSDNVSQYIFVLAMVFLGAILAELAGIEAIIGAFLAGLSLNRLIPATSPLMNRIEFVGNAIFIPFFLIGVGMLIDYRAFFVNFETIKVAIMMTTTACVSKFLAAWLTQKCFKFSTDERHLIFGLSNAQAAATLAAALVGYNVIIGENPDGTPIRLLNDSILNGTIIMILITCSIATLVAQKGAQNLSIQTTDTDTNDDNNRNERILISISNPDTIEELVLLSTIIKSKRNHNELYALNIVKNNSINNDSDKKAKKYLDKAAKVASAADFNLHKLLRYDVNIPNGIVSVIKEHDITDLILGLHNNSEFSKSFLGDHTEEILSRINATTFVYKAAQPISTIKRQIVIIPQNAENEFGFPFWVMKLWNIAQNTGAKILFYGATSTIKILRGIQIKYPIEAEFLIFDDWNDFLILARDIRIDDNLFIVMSRTNKPSYHNSMLNIPTYLDKYFKYNSFILLYPMQNRISADKDDIDLNNPSMSEQFEKLDEIGKTLLKFFKKGNR